MVGSNLKPPTSASATTIKFLCSYSGLILPRHPDGKLRYHGGETRVLSVPRSISFSDLLTKMGELCGASVSLRCQLPNEDLDALVSITSDEDLANLIEEYDRASTPNASLKIRAFLSPPKKISPPPPSSSSSSSSSKSSSSNSWGASASTSVNPTPRCYHHQISSKPVGYTSTAAKKVVVSPHYAYYAHGKPSHVYLVHNGNHWQ